jgi:copper chaperone CopZ
MRQLFAVLCTGLATAVLCAAQAGSLNVEVKGPHVCCKQCVNVVHKILDKLDGVSDVKAEPKNRTVTFTAKDAQAAKAGFKALIDGGFFGTATQGGKEIKLEIPAAKRGEKADTITVKDVHVCCPQCQNAINKVFTNAKVSYTGKGPQRTVIIEGKGLDQSEVLEALQKAGFHGNVAK